MSLTEFNAPKKAEGAEQTLRHVLEQGVTVLNTACFYGDSLNEEIIGTATGLPHSPVMMPHILQFILAASKHVWHLQTADQERTHTARKCTDALPHSFRYEARSVKEIVTWLHIKQI